MHEFESQEESSDTGVVPGAKAEKEGGGALGGKNIGAFSVNHAPVMPNPISSSATETLRLWVSQILGVQLLHVWFVIYFILSGDKRFLSVTVRRGRPGAQS